MRKFYLPKILVSSFTCQHYEINDKLNILNFSDFRIKVQFCTLNCFTDTKLKENLNDRPTNIPYIIVYSANMNFLILRKLNNSNFISIKFRTNLFFPYFSVPRVNSVTGQEYSIKKTIYCKNTNTI